MTCPICAAGVDPVYGTCRACSPVPVAVAAAPSIRPVPIAIASDVRVPTDWSELTLDAQLAEARARLAVLTRHIEAAQAERDAIVEVLAAAQHVPAPVADVAPVAGSGVAPAPVRRAPTLRSSTFGVTFGGPHGALVELAAAIGADPLAPAPAPVWRAPVPSINLRPESEHAVWSALAGGATAITLTGRPGSGTSTLLAVLGAGAAAHGFAGSLWIGEARGPALDVAQRLAAQLDPGGGARYRSAAEIRRDFRSVRALVLVDRANLTAADWGELVELLPAFCFVAGDCADGAGRASIELGALDPAGAAALVEAGYGRTITGRERQAALELTATVGGLPGAVRLIGISAAELNRPFVSLRSEFGDGATTIGALVARLSPLEQRILGVLMRADAPLSAEMLEHVIRFGSVKLALERLADCDLIRHTGHTYELPRYVAPFVPPAPDADAIFERLVDLFGAAFDPWTGEPVSDEQLIAAEPILQAAFERFDWPRVLALGPRLAEMFAIRGLLGAWGRTLNLLAAAAKRVGDLPALSLARHELGVRALMLGEDHKARTSLRSAIREREAAGDRDGAAQSTAVLALVDAAAARGRIPDDEDGAVMPPPPRATVARAQTPAAEPAPGSETPARNGRTAAPPRAPRPVPPPPSRADVRLRATARLSASLRTIVPFVAMIDRRVALALAGVVLVATLFGAWLLWRPAAAPAIADFSADRSTLDRGDTAHMCARVIGAATVVVGPDVGPLPRDGTNCVDVRPTATTTYILTAGGADGRDTHAELTIAVREPGAPRALRIESFSAHPARIVAGGSTRLCYAVTGADALRIVPSVGELVRLRACRDVRLTDAHAYTYKLLAVGENASIAVRQVRIEVVAAPALRPSAVSAPALSDAPQPPGRADTPAAAPRVLAVSEAPARAGLRTAPPRGWQAQDAIYQFDLRPAVVRRGQSASLCVGVGRFARGSVTEIGELQPGITRCYRVHPGATTTYRLRVSLDRSVAERTKTLAVDAPARSRRDDVAHAQQR